MGIPTRRAACHYNGMIPRRFFPAFSAILATSLAALPACAQDSSFDAYMQQVAAKARAEGVSERSINMLYGMTPNDRVIALDRDNVSSGANPPHTFATTTPRHGSMAAGGFMTGCGLMPQWSRRATAFPKRS